MRIDDHGRVAVPSASNGRQDVPVTVLTCAPASNPGSLTQGRLTVPKQLNTFLKAEDRGIMESCIDALVKQKKQLT